MNAKPIVLLTLACCWFAGSLYFIFGGFILRETRLGVIAQLLDKLPPTLGNPIFLFLWLVFLLGWTIPLALGLRWLFRAKH